MDHLFLFLNNSLAIWVDIAPWLLTGLMMAGVLKVFFPAELVQRWLGGKGVAAILRAAVIGTPLPLCSCSVLPTAMQLRRSGASQGATASFLVATPENGADSIVLSYVLLGPVMTVLRPVAAIISAVITGVLTEWASRSQKPQELPQETPACCGAAACCEEAVSVNSDKSTLFIKWKVVRDAAVDLLDDLAGWLLIGILLAAALKTFVPEDSLTGLGSGLLPMLVIAVISVPMYICATASTPVAASMLLAGMSPGTVLVFLLAGPATNIASAGVLWRELGGRATLAYLAGIVGSSIGIGLAADTVFASMDLHVVEQVGSAAEFVPRWVSLPAAILLTLLMIQPLRAVRGRF